MTAADHSYLEPTVYVVYPDDVAEFRATYQMPNTRAPEGRAEGLARMTDAEVASLAESLRMAVLHRPSEIARLWSIVCARGLT